MKRKRAKSWNKKAWNGKVSDIQDAHKILRKTNISYRALIHTPTCPYHGVRNFSFSETFAYVLNDYP